MTNRKRVACEPRARPSCLVNIDFKVSSGTVFLFWNERDSHMKVDAKVPGFKKDDYFPAVASYSGTRKNYTITITNKKTPDLEMKIEVSQEELDRLRQGFSLPTSAERPLAYKRPKGAKEEYIAPSLFAS